MRGRMDDRKSYATPVRLGDVMGGEAVARVLASNHSGYAEGEIVLAPTRWRTHALSDGTGPYGRSLRKLDPAVAPVTTGLGVLRHAGLHRLQRRASDRQAAARRDRRRGGCERTGRVPRRSTGQARRCQGGRHCRRPGEMRLVKDELRFDAAIDHHAADFPAQLAAACPNGIDIYFENVGGAIWQAVLPLLNKYARVPVGGLIAQYNGVSGSDGTDRLPATMREILSKSLTLRGFINYDFAAQYYADFLREVGAGIADGSIRDREDVVDGLENAPEAFIGMLDGRNFGSSSCASRRTPPDREDALRAVGDPRIRILTQA
jgi:NADPH-dependent curcumin reductase CurA